MPAYASTTARTGEAVLRTADASSVTIYVTNSNGALDAELGGRTDAPDLHVDDIVAVQDSPNPPAQIGSLVFGRHVDRIGLAAATRRPRSSPLSPSTTRARCRCTSS